MTRIVEKPTLPERVKEVLSEREASEFLGLSERKLYSLRKQGLLPYVNVPGGGRILYRRASLEQWILDKETLGAAK